jgi:hypothetical protein
MRYAMCGLLVLACSTSKPAPKRSSTTLAIANQTTADTVVYVSFGSDSEITTGAWSFCKGSRLSCRFPLKGSTSITMPNPNGKYINATVAFGQPVGCGATKAEVNINNPRWYDTLDVSLVDGYSNKIQIGLIPTKGPKQLLGPVRGRAGNAALLGVFPYGCDICVARQAPPCGIPKGKTGCKDGTQYDPKPPCQWQGPTKGGGDLSVMISLVQ